MAKSTYFQNALLNLVYRAVAWASMADNAASSPFTNIYIGLHTGALAAGDAQSINEATYTGYARKAVARNTTKWSAPSGGSLANAELEQFVECSGGSNLITHISLGIGSSGATSTLHVGALSSSRTISNGIQPQISIGALTVTET